MSPRRFHLNVAGPFYVEDGSCITCGAPEAEAPGLMGSVDEEGHCYFKRQPETEEEVEQAINAVRVSCCRGVRYGGDDPEIIRRLGEGYDAPSLTGGSDIEAARAITAADRERGRRATRMALVQCARLAPSVAALPIIARLAVDRGLGPDASIVLGAAAALTLALVIERALGPVK